MSKLRGKFVTIDGRGTYQLKEEIDGVPQVIGGKHPACPCCRKPMEPAFDVHQLGFWEDSFKTLLVCERCYVAVVYVYLLSRIEPRRGKKNAK